jgi:hypothetical protein
VIPLEKRVNVLTFYRQKRRKLLLLPQPLLNQKQTKNRLPHKQKNPRQTKTPKTTAPRKPLPGAISSLPTAQLIS